MPYGILIFHYGDFGRAARRVAHLINVQLKRSLVHTFVRLLSLKYQNYSSSCKFND